MGTHRSYQFVYEDYGGLHSKQAVEKKLVTKAEFGINPGSELVRYTAERDGLLSIFEDLDAKIFTNACDHVLDSGHVLAQIRTQRTVLFTPSIVTFLNATMETQTPTPL